MSYLVAKAYGLSEAHYNEHLAFCDRFPAFYFYCIVIYKPIKKSLFWNICYNIADYSSELNS